MENLTLAVAVISSILILVLRPAWGLALFFAVLYLYPSYLSVILFGCNFTAQRIVIAVLLLKTLMSSQITSRFKFNLIDKLVIITFLTGLISLMATMNFENFAKTYSGQFMDSVLVYFAVRLILVDKKAVMTMLKGIGVIFIAAAGFGAIQAVTGRSPYDGLYAYCPWDEGGNVLTISMRTGFYRAAGACAVHIMFGLSFVVFLPVFLLLRHDSNFWKKMAYIFLAAGIIGVCSSMSSGPYLGMMVIFLCFFLKLRPAYIKPVLITLLIMVICGQLLSNRGFLYIVGRLTFDEETAYYRARLIDVAISKLPEYFFFGYGFDDPGWGPLIDGRQHSDLCNAYVLHAAQYGFLSLIPLIAMMWASIAGFCRLIKSASQDWIRDAAWFTASALISLIVVFFSVGIFGKFVSIFYALMGVCGAFYIGKKPQVLTNPIPPLQRKQSLFTQRIFADNVSETK